MTEKDSKDKPILYILVRSDLASMNAGKMAAQVSHAANAMVFEIEQSKDVYFKSLLQTWQNETSQGFGTAIVLDVGSGGKLTGLINSTKFSPKVFSNQILDPTYPIKDGDVIHHIPLVTCAYAFMTKEVANTIYGLKTLPLYP